MGMTTRTYTPWTTAEVAKLRELYPSLGASGCVPHFPGRTVVQLRSYAHHIGVKCADPDPGSRMPREKALNRVRQLMRLYGITAAEVAA
jgi:hypothetical protein